MLNLMVCALHTLVHTSRLGPFRKYKMYTTRLFKNKQKGAEQKLTFLPPSNSAVLAPNTNDFPERG